MRNRLDLRPCPCLYKRFQIFININEQFPPKTTQQSSMLPLNPCNVNRFQRNYISQLILHCSSEKNFQHEHFLWIPAFLPPYTTKLNSHFPENLNQPIPLSRRPNNPLYFKVANTPTCAVSFLKTEIILISNNYLLTTKEMIGKPLPPKSMHFRVKFKTMHVK